MSYVLTLPPFSFLFADTFDALSMKPLRPSIRRYLYVDAANPEIWQALKQEFEEPYSAKYVFDKLAYCDKNNLDPANYQQVRSVHQHIRLRR